MLRTLSDTSCTLRTALSTDPPTFDLQAHSVHSDGALAPGAVVEAAASAGVELFSLTDHDTVAGVPEARRAAQQAGLALVAGVEVSTIDTGQGDLHVLGYLVDERDSALSDRLEQYRADRLGRADAISEALRELGFELVEAPLSERRAQGKSVGRPHLAAAVVAHPANAERLAAEECLDPSAFLERYLIEGRAGFRPRNAPSVAEAIDVIHAAGGVAVWAHPFWDVEDPPAVLESIDRFRALGIDGVECFYPTHTREQAELLANHCDALGLLSTGSSDFHGPRHREFSRFRAFSTYGREPALGRIDF
jgi:predicted metal-dependent phosphoesterase TrpH